MHHFDYVVVGAGSAGSTLASRLSESGKFTVCLLEVGGSDRKFWVQISTKGGIRASAARSYLWSLRKRHNLSIQQKAHVVDLPGWGVEINPSWLDRSNYQISEYNL